VCEGSDTFRVARSSDGQHLGASKTQMRKRFIPAEEVSQCLHEAANELAAIRPAKNLIPGSQMVRVHPVSPENMLTVPGAGGVIHERSTRRTKVRILWIAEA